MNGSFEEPMPSRQQACSGNLWKAALLTISIVLSGCSGDEKTEKSKSKKESAGSEQSINLIGNAVNMLAPERLDISSDVPTALAVMNDWLSAEDAQDRTESIPEEQLAQVLDAASVSALTRPRFVAADCRHVHFAMTARAICDAVGQGAKNDSDRVNRLFNFVIRNTTLQSRSSFDLPMSPFESLLFGLAIPEDRAWIFAELCRQLYLDTIVLGLPAESRSDIPPWIVGVILDGDLLLFDMQLGIPVCKVDDDGRPIHPLVPASFEEWSQNPACWKLLSPLPERTYPINAEKLLKSSLPLVITHRDLWSVRIKRLQTGLAGRTSIVVYQSLVPDGDDPGTLTRVSRALKEFMSPESIGVWTYPTLRRTAMSKLTETQETLHQRLQRVMSSPNWVEMEMKGKQTVGIDGQPIDSGQSSVDRRDLSRSLRKTRVDHLTGNSRDAIAAYQNIRYYVVSRMDSPQLKQTISPMTYQANVAAGEAATYFAGVCQMDIGDFLAAKNSLRQYTNQFPASLWSNSARMAEALSLIELERYSEVSAVVEDIDARSADWLSAQVLNYLAREYQSAESASAQSESAQSGPAESGPAESGPAESGPAKAPAETDKDAKPEDADAADSETPGNTEADETAGDSGETSDDGDSNE